MTLPRGVPKVKVRTVSTLEELYQWHIKLLAHKGGTFKKNDVSAGGKEVACFVRAVSRLLRLRKTKQGMATKLTQWSAPPL